jgi:type 1 glutamine amidotransferase
MPGHLIYVTEVAPYPIDERRPDDQRRLAGAHHCLPGTIAIMRQLALMAGLTYAHYDDVSKIREEELERATVLALFTIGETPWSEQQKRVILQNLRKGATGLMPLHSAADACLSWPEYGQLVGARFDGHPWTREFRIEILDRNHPATRHLGGDWHLLDEIYLFRELRPDARVLLRADPAGLDMTVRGARIPEGGLPLAWSFTEGRGRVFYTALGHFPAAYENPTFLGHLHGGLEYVLRGES